MKKQRLWQIIAGITLLAGMAVAISSSAGVEAAPPSQGDRLTFTDIAPATGTLDANTPQAIYTFACVGTGLASVVAETTSGDLETTLIVTTAQGAAIAQGSLVSGNPNISAAETFEMPAGGLCQVLVQRVGNTSGGYALRLLPGFATLAKYDRFDDPNDPLQMYWEPFASANVTVTPANQALEIQVLVDNMIGYALPSGANTVWDDFYVQTTFNIQGTPVYAEYGVILRSDDDVTQFYLLVFSTDGDWSLVWFDGEWETVQDWTVSPLIDGTATTPTIGVAVQGNRFRVYFEGALVGQVTDPVTRAAEGTAGVLVSTGANQGIPLMATIDNFIITTPFDATAPSLPFGGADDAGIGGEPGPVPTATPGGLGTLFGDGGAANTPVPGLPPTTTMPPPDVPAVFLGTLTTWDSGSPKQIVGELQNFGFAPEGGAVALTLPALTGQASTPAFTYVEIPESGTYRNFVLAFDVDFVSLGAESGCGMIFRGATQLQNNDALVFEDTYFLLGEWDAGGDLTDASRYDPSGAVNGGMGAHNHVIVVANEADVAMFVNGQLVAETTFTARAGEVAMEVYVAEEGAGAGQPVQCELTNIWLWEF